MPLPPHLPVGIPPPPRPFFPPCYVYKPRKSRVSLDPAGFRLEGLCCCCSASCMSPCVSQSTATQAKGRTWRRSTDDGRGRPPLGRRESRSMQRTRSRDLAQKRRCVLGLQTTCRRTPAGRRSLAPWPMRRISSAGSCASRSIASATKACGEIPLVMRLKTSS